MFTVAERDSVRDRLTDLAKSDERIVAAALVGGSAEGGDRWSDLDLAFGVAENHTVGEVLEDYTSLFVKEFNVSILFDLPYGKTVYRVFLTPSNLQIDLSLTPGSDFESHSPRFKLLFGKFLEKYEGADPRPEHIFGMAVHHLVRARLSIERGRLWQAEYWINAGRDETFTLMCLERGLRLREGRGYDDLPKEILEPFKKTFVGSLSRERLLIALDALVNCFLDNAGSQKARAVKLTPQLVSLTQTEHMIGDAI